jgi:hypothetical protein
LSNSTVSKRAAPVQNRRLRRTRPPREQSRHSVVAAYARVADAVNLSADDVRAAWLASKNRKTPEQWSEAHFRAIVFLNQSESQLESVIRRSVALANRLHPLVRDRQRFFYFHPHDARNSEEGLPDGTLLDRKLLRLYYWENKREDSEPNGVQQTWLEDLAAISASVGGVALQCLGVVRPSNFERVVKPLLELPS